jgi:hypothetical protein
MDLCTPEQAMQMNTPYGTDAQEGFLLGQSIQICSKNYATLSGSNGSNPWVYVIGI